MECRPAERDPGVFVDGKLNKSQQHALEDKRANHILGHKHSIASQVNRSDCPTTLCIGAASPGGTVHSSGLHSMQI